MTRDVIYDSILSKNKKVLHEKVGKAILGVYEDEIESYYEALAEHFNRSENYEAAANYWRFAANGAARLNLMQEAISFCNRQIVCIERLPQTEPFQKKNIRARVALAGY